MNNFQYFFILGAPDPENREIEDTLKKLNLPYGYALKDSKRVRSYEAYNSDEVHEVIKPLSYESQDLKIVLVECGGDRLLEMLTPWQKIIVDHHAEGHPGYGLPPSEFWKGSSIGQVFTLLNLIPTKEHLMIAAADHCLGAAYAGLCPDIIPTELLDLRVLIKSSYKCLTVDQILNQINNAINLIKKSNKITILGEPIADFTYYPPPSELGEAASILNISVTYGEFVKGLGKYKYGITSSKPEVILHWMKNHAVRLDLYNIYGDAERGYAGGYRDTRIGT